ncbi:YybH family protein [Pseudomonadota bacterium]
MPNLKQLELACIFLLMTCSAIAQEPDLAQLQKQVEDTERAFASTMADRDHGAFMSFLSEETIFFAGDAPLRGRQQVADAWAPYFDGPEAPFSWEPETVVVLDSGTLALSTGPVRDPAGNPVATFNSIWRLDPQGQWKIVFDKGSIICDDPSPVEEE